MYSSSTTVLPEAVSCRHQRIPCCRVEGYNCFPLPSCLSRGAISPIYSAETSWCYVAVLTSPRQEQREREVQTEAIEGEGHAEEPGLTRLGEMGGEAAGCPDDVTDAGVSAFTVELGVDADAMDGGHLARLGEQWA